MEDKREASSLFPWPPVIYATAFIAAWLCQQFWPMRVVPDNVADVARVVGVIVILIGVGVALAAELRFFNAGTATLPNHPTSVIVQDGIYRHTRNPMYLGMCLVLVGLAPAWNSLWCWIALPFALFAVTKLAIEREEAYLAREFGEVYVAYRARTRRWF
jgi:protein-S-isoprenylcysteine O-methyltransferase Ste14